MISRSDSDPTLPTAAKPLASSIIFRLEGEKRVSRQKFFPQAQESDRSLIPCYRMSCDIQFAIIFAVGEIMGSKMKIRDNNLARSRILFVCWVNSPERLASWPPVGGKRDHGPLRLRADRSQK